MVRGGGGNGFVRLGSTELDFSTSVQRGGKMGG